MLAALLPANADILCGKREARRTIEDAIALAALAHIYQVDKQGVSYILHPVRVMLRFKREPAQMVAVLHDLLEDTAVTASDLRLAGYPEEVVDAVVTLTRVAGETYDAFIDRVMKNQLAARVKVADIEDNLARITPALEERLGARYRLALERLANHPLPCECGCGRLVPGGHLEAAHPEDYKYDERA